MAPIRGADVKIELFYSGVWNDLTCDTTSAEWQWGAPEALGPLTEVEGGTLRVSLYDPTRRFDPDNTGSPLYGLLKVGIGFRVTVDASAAWTGVLQTWGWDRGGDIADLNGLDPIGQLSVRALPAGTTLLATRDGETSAQQAQYLLDLVEWSAGKRYFPSGTAGVIRSNEYVDGPVLDSLHRIRYAELGRLYPMRDGRIGWWARTPPSPPASSAIINCGGAGLTDMWKAKGLGRVRNRVAIAGIGVFGSVLPPDEYRTVNTTPEFLHISSADSPAPLAEDLWAQTILEALEAPPTLTALGTILPENADVKKVVCAEFGARWTVAVTGQPDTLVQVLGQRVALAPGTIEVDAVTEDVGTAAAPFVHAAEGAASGYLTSSNATYTTARTGSGVVVTPGFTYTVGQAIVPGPLYAIYETFLSFDTTSIPAGATILEATFGGVIRFHVPQAGSTQVDFILQVRSYPSGGWMPTLAAADWVGGASLSTYPLRATFDTTRGNGFFEFTDAGLAAAIVKGGTTQLVVVSSRTVAGSVPAINTAFEDVAIDRPRIRVRYQ